MDSALKPFDPATEETASLYVLELLSPPERHEFEQHLERDPALRELVRDLQGNLDAIAFDEPAAPAPLHVWGRIAAEVKDDGATVLSFPSWARRGGLRLLAAAACLAFGAWLHARLTIPTRTAPIVASAHLPPTPAAISTPTDSLAAAPYPTTPVTQPSLITTAPTNLAALAEAARLRERVRVLAVQVAALNQILTQQVALPNGVTKLHVFQLVSTNGPDDPRAHAPLQSLPETLAQLAISQLAPLPSDRTLKTTATDAPADHATGTVDVATTGTALSAGLPLNGGQPIGFYNPDTGRGAIALFDGGQAVNQDFVVWSMTTGADGNSEFHNVGTSSAAGQPTVNSVNAPTGAGIPPTFFVTLEPTGGATPPATPTGPVIAGPPPAKP